MNKVIKNTKQIAGFIITLFLAFIFFFIVKLFVFIFTLFVEFVILNSVECGCAIGYMALVALIGFIIYLYCMRVGSIVDRITDKQHASFKEWIMAIPALIVIGICYVIFYCIIYVFLWKWIIYATYVGLRNAFSHLQVYLENILEHLIQTIVQELNGMKKRKINIKNN